MNIGQEGYGTAFNATESTMDESNITESIVSYAERAPAAEGNVQALGDCLNKPEIRTPPPSSESILCT